MEDDALTMETQQEVRCVNGAESVCLGWKLLHVHREAGRGQRSGECWSARLIPPEWQNVPPSQNAETKNRQSD